MFRSILSWPRITQLLSHLQKDWVSLCRTIERRFQMIKRSITSYCGRNIKRLWFITYLSLLIFVESFGGRSKALVFRWLGLNRLEWWFLDCILSGRWRRGLEIYIFSMLGNVFTATVVHDCIEKCPYSPWLKIWSLLMLSICKLNLHFVISRPSASIRWSYKPPYSILCPHCPFWIYLLSICDVVITRSWVLFI